MSIHIANSILTTYLAAGVEALSDSGTTRATGTEDADFAVIETGRIAAYPNHSIHPDVGIIARDRGTIALQSAARADELNEPIIWLRTSSITTELVAKSTAGPFFGFHPKAWVTDDRSEAEAVVTDEAASLLPLESGFREDLTRAWFIITGLPLVTHVLATPPGADPITVREVVDWFVESGKLTDIDRAAARSAVAEETGIPLDAVSDLLVSLRWSMDVDDRRSIAELFARAGVASRVGPVRWYRD